MKRLKSHTKIICLSMLLTLFFNALMSNVFDLVEYYSFKFRDFKSLSENNEKFKVMSFSESGYKLFIKKIVYKEENEFWLNGNLFDILKLEKTKDSIFLYCYQDDEEVQFVERLSGKLEKKLFGLMDFLAKNIQKLKRFLDYQFFLKLRDNFNFDNAGFFFPVFAISDLLSPFLHVETPPPNF